MILVSLALVGRILLETGSLYIRFGKDQKPLLIFSGESGNYLSGLMAKQFNFLVKHYALYMLSRKVDCLKATLLRTWQKTLQQ